MGLCDSAKEQKFYTIDPYIAKVSKAMCKIETNKKISSGFLIKLFKGEKEFFCLMTNEHTITKEMIAKRSSFNFYYDSSDFQSKTIDLNPQERYIKYFTNINIDVSIIEILPKDNIPKYYFLSANIVYMYNFDKLINQEIAILHYPKGILSYSYGIITAKTNTYEFSHSASTEEGSSGAPIFLKNSDKVIGIHTGSNLAKTINYGNFIGPIFDYLRKKSHQKNNLIINPQNINNNINYKMNNLNYPCNLNKINALNNQNNINNINNYMTNKNMNYNATKTFNPINNKMKIQQFNQSNNYLNSFNGINPLINRTFTTPKIINVLFVTDFGNKEIIQIPQNYTIYQMMQMYMKRNGLSEYNLRNDLFFLYMASKMDPFSNELALKKFKNYSVTITVCQRNILTGGFKLYLNMR